MNATVSTGSVTSQARGLVLFGHPPQTAAGLALSAAGPTAVALFATLPAPSRSAWYRVTVQPGGDVGLTAALITALAVLTSVLESE